MSEPGPSRRRSVLPEYLPARMLNEYVYCPRLFFYEWVERLFAESADTVEGTLRHEKLEVKQDALPDPAESKPGAKPGQARSVTLSSERLRLIAGIDLVEVEGEGRGVTPVDYKKGSPRDGDDGPVAWPPDRVQLCAQALVLREHGYRCDEGVLYYSQTKQRVRVPIDDELVAETLAAADAARRVAEAGAIPPPLVDSPKCPRCSLVGICLPDETVWCEQVALEPDLQLPLFGADPAERQATEGTAGTAGTAGKESDDGLRRLVPARDDLRPLYVTGHGLTVGKSGEVLRVKGREKKLLQEARIGEISQVSVFGNVQVTAQALHTLCKAERPIAHFSHGGWFYGLTHGLGLKNVFLRQGQFARASEEFFRLHVARPLVASKIRNQRTLLQRNHTEPPRTVLKRLKEFAEQARGATDAAQLLGLEGAAARLYFQSLPGMLKGDRAGDRAHADGVPDGLTFDFQSRNRRPPRDPVNALLSFAYSLLVKDLTIVCYAVGFDPFIGFYHQPRFGRPALALDLMEEFRPLIADSAVLSAINTRMVASKHFIRAGSAVSLKPAGRKALLRAYEQRMDTLVTHPLFGYRASYRRVLEIQTRLLARVVTGELPRYPGFLTR